MHLSHFSKPSKAAARFVQFYVQREARLGAATLIHPVPARAAHMLNFQFGGPVEVRLYGSDVSRTAETDALVGPQTYQRSQLFVRGNVETFAIIFRPSAIYQLFGLPAIETTNRDYAAHAVLGAAVLELRQQMGNVRTFPERAQIADQFITRRSFRAQAADSIELAANEIMHNHGGCRINSVAHHTGLNVRSFQRAFQKRIGVTPKLYARIIRFESALKTKAASPHITWTTVAHEFGYHDQMHMVHDFQQLSGEGPSSLLMHAEAVLAPQIDSAAGRDPDLLVL